MNNKDNFWMEEPSENLPVFLKRKRRIGKRKLEFVGWGSRPLIEFLQAIGQDTTKEHSRHDVATFITKYIKEKNLACAEKKKKILCDERLYDLFAKKTMSRIKVFEMLEEHYAENHVDSDSESPDTSEEENYGQTSSKNYTQTKKVPKTPRSCFAAIVAENIKMIHLKRSLILELLKAPESFECKIIGSFVRIRSDPNDIYQKNRFQLQQVTGVERVPGTGDASNEIRLKVLNFFKEISIRDLSDDNFTEEEIVDLRDRIKSGILKRLIVSDVESKAEMLHVDITKHWIAREIASLQSLSDRANEKGWRREFYEYQERRKKLQTPSEQEKLLQNIPEVIAEEIEPENVVATGSEKVESNGPAKLIVNDRSDVPVIVVPEGRKKQQMPRVREKLLHKTPEVITEEEEPEDIVTAGSEEVGSACPLKSIVRSTSVPIVPETEDIAAQVQLNSNAQEVHYGDAKRFVQNGDANGSVPVQNSDRHQHAMGTPEQVKETGSHEADAGDEHADLILQDGLTPNGIDGPNPQDKQGQTSTMTEQSNAPMTHAFFPYPQEKSAQLVIDLTSTPTVQASSSYPQAIASGLSTHNQTPELSAQPMNPELAKKATPPTNARQTAADGKKPTQVIELSDDESADDEPTANNQNPVINPYEAIWYYRDPQGQTQGPFALHMLKRWFDANYFPPDFTIWRNGQANFFDAILLTDALGRAFPPFPVYPFRPF